MSGDGLESTQSIGHGYWILHFFWDISIACHLYFSVNPFLKAYRQDYMTSNYHSADLIAFHESLVQSVKMAGISDEVATGLRSVHSVQNGGGILLNEHMKCQFIRFLGNAPLKHQGLLIRGWHNCGCTFNSFLESGYPPPLMCFLAAQQHQGWHSQMLQLDALSCMLIAIVQPWFAWRRAVELAGLWKWSLDGRQDLGNHGAWTLESQPLMF